MALKMRVSTRYGTHLPALLECVRRTTGPILELGVGAFSTPVLDALCQMSGRLLVSCETDGDYGAWAQAYARPNHPVLRLDSWDAAPIEARQWSVALVDHSPDTRRVVEVERLAQRCECVVLHDSNGRYEHHYHYSTIYPLFRWRWDDTHAEPSTTVLSNYLDLTGWGARP